jgi:ABC-type nitrate/sulfonate/bicarbonate transport system ATPase subunit
LHQEIASQRLDYPRRFGDVGDQVRHERADIGKLILEYAASLNVHMLYPMSGLETEEPVLQPGRIDVLLGQGQTAQVLRNLCLIVQRDSPKDWKRIVELMRRLFSVDIEDPQQTSRGAIQLGFRQDGVKESLDLSLSGRGFQQLLLIFSYLFSHKKSVLLIDEPDAHLEILRQKQVYVLLRDIASQNESQVILVTHSEVILEEALDTNLTLLLDGRADDLANKSDIRNSLKNYGAAHYVKARERGYVLYVEGGTDLDMLRAFADLLDHPVANIWDPQLNSFYVQNNHPEATEESELQRVEGGFGVSPEKHFYALKESIKALRGVANLDDDGKSRRSKQEGDFIVRYWSRYEIENYFVTPDLLRRYAERHYESDSLFGGYRREIADVLATWTLEFVFENKEADYEAFSQMSGSVAKLLWEKSTARIKLSHYAEEFFRRLSAELGFPLIMRKGELHNLIANADPNSIDHEVRDRLDLLLDLFQNATPLR